MEVPIDAVDADQLPKDRGIKYEDIVRIVGNLYLDSQHLFLPVYFSPFVRMNHIISISRLLIPQVCGIRSKML